MKKNLTPPSRRRIKNNARLAAASCFVFLLIAAALIVSTAITSGSGDLPRTSAIGPGPLRLAPAPSPTPVSTAPVQTSATRVSIIVGRMHDLQIATGVDSFIIVSPEIASGVAKNRFTISIAALKIGETMLLAKLGAQRQTYIIEVVGKSRADSNSDKASNVSNALPRESLSTGSFTTTYASGSSGAPSLARQNVDFRKKLSKGRTLRVSGEMFKLFGGTTSEIAIARVQNFALNRVSVGLDTSDRTIDVLDSQVNLSPMSFSGYTSRGFHLKNTPKSEATANFQKKGLEVYAGLARPSLAFFDTGGGKVAGAMIPLITTDNFQARTGFTAIVADKNSRDARGGVVAHSDVIYAPTKGVSVEGEMSLAKGDLSWRARIDVKKAVYGGSAEITRFARSSPLNSIGAQPGGRKSELLSLYWRPAARISTSIGFNHTNISRVIGSQLADYDRSLMFANASFGIAKNSRMNLRYTDQKIESAFPGSLSKFNIETRTISIGNTHRFTKVWSNSIEGRINFNREANANAKLETGFSLKEQIRAAWSGNSITGFINYNRKSPSLVSLLVRNPRLLPTPFQAAFALDPAEFLRVNRDRIAYLLGGVELPQTRNIDAGVRFQKTISRFTISGETRYNGGEIYAVNQKTVSTSLSLGMRLDSANSIQVNAWKSVGGNPQSAVTVSYTHHLGSSGDGFRLSRLFSFFNRGRIKGRVFYDLNSNGKHDLFEPGVAGITIQIDGRKQVVTGKDGTYSLKANEGTHRVVVLSNHLGVSLLASTPINHRLYLNGGQAINLDFGLRDSGSISGSVSDGASGLRDPAKPGGLGGVRVTLRSSETGLGNFTLERVTAANGSYEFRDLRPGKYLIEIDPATIPADYRIPDITALTATVIPLSGATGDFWIEGQRAVTGVIYFDTNGDGKYTSQTDRTFAGAEITGGNRTVISGVGGTYLFRNLSTGRTTLIAKTPDGLVSAPVVVQFGQGPETKRRLDLQVFRR